MRAVIRIDDEEHPLVVDGAVAEASIPCPHCAKPLRVMGSGIQIGGHDYYAADGFCANGECGKRVGQIRAYVSTIFGLEEDLRMQSGPAKVY